MNLDVLLDGHLEHGAVVEVGTTRARVSWLGGRFHQLRCEDAVPVARGDAIEAAGVRGVVLDPDAPRHAVTNDLLVALTETARELGALPPETGPTLDDARAAAGRLRAAGGDVTATRLARELRTTAAVARDLLERLRD